MIIEFIKCIFNKFEEEVELTEADIELIKD